MRVIPDPRNMEVLGDLFHFSRTLRAEAQAEWVQANQPVDTELHSTFKSYCRECVCACSAALVVSNSL